LPFEIFPRRRYLIRLKLSLPLSLNERLTLRHARKTTILRLTCGFNKLSMDPLHPFRPILEGPELGETANCHIVECSVIHSGTEDKRRNGGQAAGRT
jgi:hypothetical protein